MGNSLCNLAEKDPLISLDFSSYDDACLHDADVQQFDRNLKARTDRVLTSIVEGGNENKFSFDSLKQVTTSLLDVDREIMDVILEYKEDVWKDSEVLELVNEFFANSLATLDFCTAAEISIQSAKETQGYLQMALDRILPDRDPDEQEIKSMLNALDYFCKAENPFGTTFIQKFEAVQDRHTAMLVKLKDKKSRLDRKLKNVKVWAKVSSILFGAAVAAVLICSIVAAAIAAPPVAGALAAAASLPLGSVGAWVKSAWKKYESALTERRDLIGKLHVATAIEIHDLKTIKSLASHLEIQLKSIENDYQFLKDHGDIYALRLAVEDIKAKRSGFVKELDGLQVHVEQVGHRINQARTIVMQTISHRMKSKGSDS